MASPKQTAANRANAKKSTGPSEKGKAKSRLNAVRYNLIGQSTTLSGADRGFLEKLKADHAAALAPVGLEEFKFAHAIAWDTWRLDHLSAIEMNAYTLALEESMEEAAAEAENDAGTSPDELNTALVDTRTFRAEAKRFELMSLYGQHMNRSPHRNVALFRQFQAERKRNYERDKKEEVTIARLHEFNQIPSRLPPVTREMVSFFRMRKLPSPPSASATSIPPSTSSKPPNRAICSARYISAAGIRAL